MSKSLIKQPILVNRSPPDAAQQPPALQLATGGVSGAPRGCPDPGEIGADTAPL